MSEMLKWPCVHFKTIHGQLRCWGTLPNLFKLHRPLSVKQLKEAIARQAPGNEMGPLAEIMLLFNLQFTAT